jgi:DNA-nicking Smr family endonuclease
MSATGRKPGTGGGRGITEEEARLWSHATRSLTPLRKKQHLGASTSASSLEIPSKPASKLVKREAESGDKPSGPPSVETTPRTLPRFERRQTRQIAAGRIKIEATLDLHGLTQRKARSELREFLLRARARGLKMVLVITGKGADDEPHSSIVGVGDPDRYERGVLRRAVPLWLEEPDFSAMIVGYDRAHRRHGGEGALYVRLRRRSIPR